MCITNPDHARLQLRATRALLKFCEEHGDDTSGLKDIRACIAALEANETQKALASYRKVPLGGAGCFDDWFPPVVYEHETGEYVSAVFEALISRWIQMMHLCI